MAETLDQWPAGETATMNVTYTQANAAGGAVVCEITPGAANEFIILDGRIVNSGTNGIEVKHLTAAGGSLLSFLATVASGVGTALNFNVGLVSNGFSSGNNAGFGWPTIISGTQALRIAQTAAGAQNDTFTILINIRLKTGQVPTVIHSNSTNPGNVTVTAGAESFTTV